MGLPGFNIERWRGRLPSSRREWLLLASGSLIVLAGVGIVTLLNHSRLPLKPEASTITSPWIPSTVKHWQGPINEMARKYKIDPNLVAIVMTVESGGGAKAGSEADAHGLMQITPPTAKDIAAKYLKKPVTKYDLWDPRTNIEFGTAYLALLRKEFGTWQQGPTWNSTVELIAAGYNGGPVAANHVEQGKGLHDTQTVIYSRDVFNMWRERHAGSSPTFDRWKERGGSRLIDAAKAQQ
jgi:soluble lytic murein transglycosylase-like protein